MGYVDESGFSATPDNRYAWTKKGEVHQVTAMRSKRINVLGALLSTGNLALTCFEQPINSQWFYSYLLGIAEQIKEKSGKPMVLIVDNASIHTSKKMQEWRELLKEYNTTLYFISPYSPELNRIEMIWKKMKYQWREFSVMTPKQITEWVSGISNGFGSQYTFTF